MAQLVNPFDATQINPSQGGGALPVGRHKVIIAASEVKATKANDGGYLELTLEVTEGSNAGQTGPLRLGLYSSSEKAVAFAQRRLSAICHAIQVFKVQDSVQLHQKPFMVEVGFQNLTAEQEEAKARGEAVVPFTEVKKILDANGNEPGKVTPASTQPQQASHAQNWQQNTDTVAPQGDKPAWAQ